MGQTGGIAAACDVLVVAADLPALTRIVVAIALGILFHSVTLYSRTRVQGDATLWPLMYSGVGLGLLYVGSVIHRLNRGRLRRGAPA